MFAELCVVGFRAHTCARCAVCRLCRHTHRRCEHTLRGGARTTVCVVLEAGDSTFREQHTHARTRARSHPLIVRACQMAPDIRQRLGIKLSERLLLRPPPLFSHPPFPGHN